VANVVPPKLIPFVVLIMLDAVTLLVVTLLVTVTFPIVREVVDPTLIFTLFVGVYVNPLAFAVRTRVLPTFIESVEPAAWI